VTIAIITGITINKGKIAITGHSGTVGEGETEVEVSPIETVFELLHALDIS
jgi:hypothetical protein